MAKTRCETKAFNNDEDYISFVHDMCMSDDPFIAVQGRTKKHIMPAFFRLIENEIKRGTDGQMLDYAVSQLAATMMLDYSPQNLSKQEKEIYVKEKRAFFLQEFDQFAKQFIAEDYA